MAELNSCDDRCEKYAPGINAACLLGAHLLKRCFKNTHRRKSPFQGEFCLPCWSNKKPDGQFNQLAQANVKGWERFNTESGQLQMNHNLYLKTHEWTPASVFIFRYSTLLSSV